MMKSVSDSGQKDSFEYSEWVIKIKNDNLRLRAIYRPPYSADRHRISASVFMQEFEYLESIHLYNKKLLLAGDFNLHVDVADDCGAVKFCNRINIINFRQHVQIPSNRLGHTLDLIISRDVDELTITDPVPTHYVSDHSFIETTLSLRKPSLQVKKLIYTKYREINIQSFNYISATDMMLLNQQLSNIIACNPVG